MYKTLTTPLIVQVEATYRCPCNCKHCYNFWREKADAKERLMPNLSADQMNRIVSQVVFNKVFHVVMTGGEPLVNKRVVFSGIEKLRQAGISVGMNSNLIPLKPADAKFLKELGVSGVLTSILGPDAASHDAITQRPGSFTRTIQGIRLLQEVGMPVVANMVISQANKHLLTQTAIFVKNLGLTSFFSTRAACPGNCHDFSSLALSLDEFRNYLKEFHLIGKEQNLRVGVLESYPLCGIKEVQQWPEFTGRRCLAGVTSMTVGVNCIVKPCSHLNVQYGNLATEELGTIWSKMQDWRTGALLPKTCQTCKLLPQCGGGCRMEAKMIKGSFSELDPYASPSDVPYVISCLAPKKPKKNSDNSTMVSFHLNPKVRWRRENFGSVVFLNQQSACYLNQDSTEFLAGLKINQVYPVESVTAEYGEEAVSFLLDLQEKRVILVVSKS